MADEPIRVPADAGLIDGLQAGIRYVVVLVTFTTAVLGLLKVHDIAGIITVIQSNGGQVLAAISGLIALGTAVYGIIKSKRRGSQIAAVALNPRVPSEVADIK